MTIFVSSRLNGLHATAARELTTLCQGYVTLDDYLSLHALRRMLVEELADAVAKFEAARVDYLDELYDEISAVCEEVAGRFPDQAMLD